MPARVRQSSMIRRLGAILVAATRSREGRVKKPSTSSEVAPSRMRTLLVPRNVARTAPGRKEVRAGGVHEA